MSRVVIFLLVTDGTNEIVQQFVDSLLQEFEETSSDIPWTRQLLFPHLKSFQVHKCMRGV